MGRRRYKDADTAIPIEISFIYKRWKNKMKVESNRRVNRKGRYPIFKEWESLRPRQRRRKTGKRKVKQKRTLTGKRKLKNRKKKTKNKDKNENATAIMQQIKSKKRP